MDERLQFVARRLADGGTLQRVRHSGAHRQKPPSVPLRQPTSFPGGKLYFECEARAPQLGARKIRERLIRRFSGIPIPARSTIHVVLDRHGLVERRGRVRHRAQGTALSAGQRPNQLWCTDYKGRRRPFYCCA